MSKIKQKIVEKTHNIPKKKKIVILVLLVGVASFAGWSAWEHFRPHSLIAEGSIEARQIIIRSETSGIVEKCLVEEGNTIQSGEKLFLLDQTNSALLEEQSLARLQALQAQLAELKGGSRQEQVRQASANVNQVTGLLRKAEANLAMQEASQKRYQELYDAGGISKQAMDQQDALWQQAQGDVQAINGQLQAAREQYNLLKNGASADAILALDAKVREAQAAYEQSKNNRGKTTITSLIEGTFSELLVERGEYVSPGTAVAVIKDLQQMWITGYVPASELGKVKLNQPVKIVVDAWPNEFFAGKVTYIADEAEFTPLNKQTGADRADLVFAVKVTLANSKGKLLAGMPADILFDKP